MSRLALDGQRENQHRSLVSIGLGDQAYQRSNRSAGDLRDALGSSRLDGEQEQSVGGPEK